MSELEADSNRPQPVKEALSTLARNSDIIASLLSEHEISQHGLPRATISALRQVSAILPAGEDSFRLHPRLRDYLSQHLQLFPSYESLTAIGSQVVQLGALRTEADAVRRDGDAESLRMLQDSMTSLIYDIAAAMDHNLSFLGRLLSTQYGNVRSLQAKIAQNRWYSQQSASLGHDLGRLAAVAGALEEESSSRGWSDLARVARRVLLGRMQLWQHTLSDIQTLLREEIYRFRRVSNEVDNLAKADAFLARQPAWRGLDVDLEMDDKVSVLVPAKLAPFRPHAEPSDPEPMVRKDLVAIVQALPPRDRVVADARPAPIRVVRSEPKPKPVIAPLSLALKALEADISRETPLSLANWRHGNEQARAMEEGVWLVFAVTALRSRRTAARGQHAGTPIFDVRLVKNAPREGERWAHTFRDAMARLAPGRQA